MSNPTRAHEVIIARSIAMLKKKTGMVIFVGKAARLLTSVIPIAISARTKKKIFVPERIIAKSVIGVSAQP